MEISCVWQIHQHKVGRGLSDRCRNQYQPLTIALLTEFWCRRHVCKQIDCFFKWYKTTLEKQPLSHRQSDPMHVHFLNTALKSQQQQMFRIVSWKDKRCPQNFHREKFIPFFFSNKKMQCFAYLFSALPSGNTGFVLLCGNSLKMPHSCLFFGVKRLCYSAWGRCPHLKSLRAAPLPLHSFITKPVSYNILYNYTLSTGQQLAPGKYQIPGGLCLSCDLTDTHLFPFFSRGTIGLAITLQLKASSLLYVWIFVNPLLVYTVVGAFYGVTSSDLGNI